jgi:hypothetical protein
MDKKQEKPRQGRRKPGAAFSFGGWPQWSGNEDYSFEFMRVLATATEGASTVSECFRAARHIEDSNPASWYNAWTAVAARTKRRGDAAFESGGLNMATGNWLRASNYYRTAEVLLNEDDAQRKPTIDLMRLCSRLYLQHAVPGSNIVGIDDDRGGLLEGYFLPVRSSRPAAVVIGVGGMSSFKEDLLYTMRRHGAANELSLLLVDPPVSIAPQANMAADWRKPMSRSAAGWTICARAPTSTRNGLRSMATGWERLMPLTPQSMMIALSLRCAMEDYGKPRSGLLRSGECRKTGPAGSATA